jgi:hypothetical protein
MNNIYHNPHGYYQVGADIYLNKSEAVYKSSNTNDIVEWKFHEDVYSGIDWRKRPAGTIKELYRLRAQQIRDKYDYIVVHFSGGMDSWTVLDSFLSNGIHIDEVFTRWARKERNYRDPDHTNTDESNLGSEFEYAVLPVLDHIRTHYPKTNIVIDDFSECFHESFDENMVLASNHYQSMSTFFRFNRKSEQELEQERQGKKVGVVYGYDKVRCTVENGNFYAFFADCIGGTDTDYRGVELFYWTREFPEIPVLQAHCLKQYIQENLEFPAYSRQLEYSEYREIYQAVCYPDYNIDTFQVGKSLGSLIWKSDLWIPKHNPEYYNSWRWATDQFFNGIDTKYIQKTNGVRTGLSMFSSPLYLVEENTSIPDFKWFPRKVFNT